MENTPLTEIFAKMPVEELDQSLEDFLSPIGESASASHICDTILTGV